MQLDETIFWGVGICLEFGFLYFLIIKKSRENLKITLESVAIFLTGQILVGVMFILSGYTEFNGLKISSWVGSSKNPLRKIEEYYGRRGDPLLFKLVERNVKDVPRPNVKSLREFQEWQGGLRIKLRDIFELEDIEKEVTPTVEEVRSETLESGIIRKFIYMRSFDGTRIPGFLFLPKRTAPGPAVLVLPGHVREGQEGIRQTAGLEESYHNGAALALARAGYITLTIEFRGFGSLGRPIFTEHRLLAYNALVGGTFYKAIISKDIKFAVDYLFSLPSVDFKRVGITGVSYGGEMATTYSALDNRMKVVVFNGFGGNPGPLRGIKGTKERQPHYCHFVPGVNQQFFPEDFLLLIAPRPLLGIRGDREDVVGAGNVFENIKDVYKTFLSTEQFNFKRVPGGHEFFVEQTIEFFDKFL